MLIQPYEASQLKFSWCYRVYLRWRTYRLCPHPPLAELSQSALDEIGGRFDIRVLEHATDETDVMLLLSLRPDETVSGCVSKLKGRISKWLRDRLGLTQPTNLLSRGYFASTTGKSTSDAVAQYLSKQGQHHGYTERARPPVSVCQYELTAAEEERLQAKHAHVMLRHHIVLATSRRQGVFGQAAGQAVAERWRILLRDGRAALLKVSFLPDHVHVALRLRPSVSPAELIVRMMNEAQELMFKDYDDAVIQAAIERLWEPSAYLGSFGELASPQVSKYIQRWTEEIRGE